MQNRQASLHQPLGTRQVARFRGYGDANFGQTLNLIENPRVLMLSGAHENLVTPVAASRLGSYLGHNVL